MARLFSDSFDFYNGAADVALTYSGTSGNAPSSTTAFSTGQSLGGGNPDTQLSFGWATNEPTLFGSVRLCYNLGTATASAGEYWTIFFSDAGAIQCSISWWDDGSVRVYSGTPRSGTLLNTSYSTTAFSLNSWDSWQFKVVISATAGSIEVRKNGSSTDMISVTGVNTRAGSSNSTVNGASYYWSAAYYANLWLVDDVFLSSAAGAAPTGWLGDLHPFLQTPAANVTSGFTRFPTSAASNAACIAEVKEDGDTSYITATASGTEDTFSLTAIPTGYTVLGVNYVTAWRKTDAGAVTALLTLTASGVAETTELTQASLGTSYNFSNAWLPLDPAGAVWTTAHVNAAVVGLKIQ